MTLTIEPSDTFETRPQGKRNVKRVRQLWRQAMEDGQAGLVEKFLAAPESDGQDQVAPLVDAIVSSLCDDETESVESLRETLREKLPNHEIKTETQIIVGKTVYPLLKGINTVYVADFRTVIAFPLHYLDLRGKGNTYKEAFADLSCRFHLLFQELAAYTPSTMTEDSREQWALLSSWVDVDNHRALTPIEFRRVGIIMNRYPFTVQWIDDESEQVLDLALTPGRIAAMPEGRWIAAMVEFDRVRDSVIRILSVESVEPLISEKEVCVEEKPLGQGNRMSGRYGLRIARSPFQSSRRVGDSISGTEEIHGIGTCGSRLQSF